jgi:outer membrane protein, multidrug efflux system
VQHLSLSRIITAIQYRIPALMLAAAALLPGCRTVGVDYQPQPIPAPAAWHAPLQAHGGDAAALTQWWTRFDDPALVALIGAAQRESATVAQAAARIAQARAAALTADLSDSPAMEGVVSADRAAFSFGGPAQRRTLIQIGPRASWEIDLFGGLQRSREAGSAALQSSQAAWHDARVSVAAEAAQDYLALRHCEAHLALARDELQAHRDTVRIMERALQVGLQSGAAVLIVKAAVAQAADAVQQRRAQCDTAIKALVALTAMEEPALRELIAPARAVIPRAAQFVVETVPARALAAARSRSAWQKPRVTLRCR